MSKKQEAASYLSLPAKSLVASHNPNPFCEVELTRKNPVCYLNATPRLMELPMGSFGLFGLLGAMTNSPDVQKGRLFEGFSLRGNG